MNEPFTPLQENKSLIAYSNTLTKLLSFVLRCSELGHAQERFSPNSKIASSILLNHLKGKQAGASPSSTSFMGADQRFEDDTLLSLIHSLSITLISVQFDVLDHQTSDCPLSLFVAYLHLRHQGGFEDVHLIPPKLSHIQYCIRSIVYREAALQALISGKPILE